MENNINFNVNIDNLNWGGEVVDKITQLFIENSYNRKNEGVGKDTIEQQREFIKDIFS